MIEFWVASETDSMVSSVEVLRKKAKLRELKQSKKYTATLEQLSTFEVLLGEVYVDLCPKPSDYDVRRDLVRIFNEIAKEIYDWSADAPVVEVFGSFSMDLFSAKSDLDLSVNFTNRMVNVPREKKIQTLRKFAKKFYQLQRKGFVHGVNPVTTARVPVLKVVDRGTEIECDMSVENWDGISKSNIIYMIGAIDERFRKLSFLMKEWAKAQNINSAKDQTLNSLSIILLVAFHLQTRNPPILPPFSALFRDGNDPVAVERSLCKFSNYGIGNTESVAELFFSLLTKLLSVQKLWSSGLCASTFEGSWISQTWGSRGGHINVEDFTDRSQNVSRAVGTEEIKRIYSCIQLSVQRIFDFLNKKISGHSLREFLFGRDVASKLVSTGNVEVIAKEIQACASGKKEVQSIEFSKSKKKTVHVDSIVTKSVSSVENLGGMPQGKQACASGKEVRSVERPKGNKKTVHVDSELTKSMSSGKRPGGMPQGIQACASGKEEVQSVECSEGNKKNVLVDTIVAKSMSSGERPGGMPQGIQACASGKKEMQSVECTKGNKKTVHVDSKVTKSMSSGERPGGMPQGIQACASGKEVQSVECSKGNKKTVHVDPFVTKSISSMESPGKRKLSWSSFTTHSSLTKRTRTNGSFRDNLSGGSGRQPGECLLRPEQPMPHYMTNRWEPVVDRGMISREGVCDTRPPVSFEPTYGRMRLAEPFGEVYGREGVYNVLPPVSFEPTYTLYNTPPPVSFESTNGRMRSAEHFGEKHGREISRYPYLMAPAAPHAFPSAPLVSGQMSYEPLRFPLGYSTSVYDSMHLPAYFSHPDPRRF